MIKKIILPGILFLFLFDPGFAQRTAEVNLAGYYMVPEVRTSALGFVEVTVVGDTLTVEGQFSDLRGTYWAAHIHYGGPRDSGNRLYRLSPVLNEERNGGEFKAEDNRFVLRPAQKEALDEGKLYIKIATNRNQGGEIRGQIPVM